MFSHYRIWIIAFWPTKFFEALAIEVVSLPVGLGWWKSVLVYSMKEMGVSKNNGRQIIHSNKVFHYKPSILGYPYFWKHPNRNNTTTITMQSSFKTCFLFIRPLKKGFSKTPWNNKAAIVGNKAQAYGQLKHCQQVSGSAWARLRLDLKMALRGACKEGFCGIWMSR